MAVPREVKVGAFVLAGILVAGLVIFLIGDERRLFESKVDYHAVFDDVQGLKPGSPVRMGGVDVGRVAHVGYSSDIKDSRLHVTLELVESETGRIRADSVTTIDNKGLLGDKMVVIQVGSPDKPPIEPGGTLPTQESRDFTAMLDRVTTIGEKAEHVMVNLEKATDSFADDRFRDDLGASVHHLSSILRALDQGDGYASRLLRDSKESDKVSRTLSNLERSAGQLERALSEANKAIARVNQGPGFAHDVLYGDGPTRALEQFGHAAEELATTLQGVREGDGIARGILYGDDQTRELMANLSEVSGDIKRIVSDARAGKGTLGALLVDPSVYEDLKLLLGNVQRNKALRALVRYSIQRDEKVAPVEIVDPEAAETPASSAPAAARSESGVAGRPQAD